MRVVIGIDIGTTNTKAVAFADSGVTLGSASVSYPVYRDGEGRHELDPDQLLDAVVATLREVVEKLVAAGLAGRTVKGRGLAGISFSCAMHSLIAVDEDGHPLTRAITWA